VNKPTSATSKKKIYEFADLDHFLHRLLQVDGFTPSYIEPSERPDFILTADTKKIGVEVTRLVYQERIRALKLQAERFPALWINLTHCVDEGTRRTNSDLKKAC
jgi:hypothetical protein